MRTRRNFMFTSTAMVSSAFWSQLSQADKAGGQIGHGALRYRLDKDWAKTNRKLHPVKNCHEMIQAPDGLLYMLTDHPKNNILKFDVNGEVKGSWTLNMKGGHGLTISEEEDGTPVLWVTDTRGRIVKTDLDGKELLSLPTAQRCKAYSGNTPYRPTETAVGPNGDIYVADGYGAQYILRFDKNGKYRGKFGGKSMQPTNKGKFMQVHGVAIDDRGDDPLIVCASRIRNEFQWFTLEGEFVKNVYLPGCYISRPVISGDYLYSGVCFGTYAHDFRAWRDRGFVVILDKEDKLVSAPGAIPPVYDAHGKLGHLYQEAPHFRNCHDVAVDSQGDLYVCQWAAGSVYPYKLSRV